MFNAVGKIKTTFGLMIMWTALTFAAVPALSWQLGVNGAGFGYMLVGISSVVAIAVARKIVKFSLLDGALKPLLAALVMGAAVWLVRGFVTPNFYAVGLLIFTGFLVYAFASYLLVGKSIILDVKKGFSAIVNRNS